METVLEQLQTLLGAGLDVGDVGVVQMALRTIVIYAFTLILVRLGSKRFLSEASAFDVIVSIMIGSIMSRAINGSAPLLPTLGAGVILLGLHWFFAILAYRAEWFGSIVKGNPVLLIKDGEIQHAGVRRASISSGDLEAALRLQTNQTDPAKIKLAYLERSGRISMIPFAREPHIVNVSVKDGVQTVRVELHRSAVETEKPRNGAKDGLRNG